MSGQVTLSGNVGTADDLLDLAADAFGDALEAETDHPPDAEFAPEREVEVTATVEVEGLGDP